MKRKWILTAALILLVALTGCNATNSTKPAETTENAALTQPPTLSVEGAAETKEAWLGTWSWEVESGDGEADQTVADAPDPMDQLEDIPQLVEENTRTVKLHFAVEPETVTVTAQSLEKDEAQTLTLTDGSLPLLPGSWLYQISAAFSGEGYQGQADYVFQAKQSQLVDS